MGEEEKKLEEKKPEQAQKPAEEEKKEEEAKAEKPEEKKEEEKKEEDPKDEPPPEIVLKVYMHCEGCARKVRRCLRGFEGVEDVMTDCKSHKVVVKGEKADPLKVRDRVQRKSHRQVELLSPIPKPPAEDEKKEDKEVVKPEEKKEEPPPVITVVLKVHMHCEACAQEIKKRILRMKGVESADPDLKASQVAVKGVFDPPKLVEYVYKRTGKHSVVVKQDPPEKKEEDKGKEGKEEKKAEEPETKAEGGEAKEEKKESGEAPAEAAEEGAAPVVDVKKSEYVHYYWPPTNAREFSAYPLPYAREFSAYPPQIFSDENPNACSVM
ncbi:heavy metal-associated isoprenylated plant protein 7 [Malania oleifera]|uniref:heavy metal-associated isoprenylated plant protein 7 n=1 Tax=Malania oleifera TaxID=397392 RepID=UPI0025AE4735|nr:heavy metal-associated isoprenylated plant protein 7 [Malania oleifera]